MCRQFGISTFVYNPLAGGLLTGKQPRHEPIAGNASRRTSYIWTAIGIRGTSMLWRNCGRLREKEGRSPIEYFARAGSLHHTAAGLDHSRGGLENGKEHLEQNLEGLTRVGRFPANCWRCANALQKLRAGLR